MPPGLLLGKKLLPRTNRSISFFLFREDNFVRIVLPLPCTIVFKSTENNIYKDNQEVPQSRTLVLPSQQKMESWSLRKHAYSNILKVLQPKKENLQIKNSDIFHISAQNIDCGHSLEPPRRGGSNEYPQSMFFSETKNNVNPCKPQFYYIKVGFKGVKLLACFCDVNK